MTIALRQRPLARVVAGIVRANNGAWFDPSDLSTLYQDAAGTIPVTAVGQPVGKILDKSGNGNHATQSVTASRPVLSARYNLLTSSDDASSLAWDKDLGSVVNISASNPLNLPLVSKFIPDATAGVHRVAQVWNPIPGAKYTQKVLLKSAGVRFVYININSNAGAKLCVDLQTGQYVASGLTPEGASVVGLGDGWYLCSISGTGTSQTGNKTWFQANGFFATADDYTFTGSGRNGFLIAAADLRIGTTAGPYQRVNTATDYDTDERYFKKYLRFDGVDDYLNLPYMGLYAGGAASIVCARDAVSQTTDTYIISERSTTDADPKYFPSRQLANAGNMDTFITNDAGAVVLDTVGSPFSGEANAVIRSIVDSGNNLKLFKNGTLAANDNYTRSGTLTLNNTTIGASVSTTTSNYASMKLYGLIVTKSALTDSQRVACERYLGRKSGVQL